MPRRSEGLPLPGSAELPRIARYTAEEKKEVRRATLRAHFDHVRRTPAANAELRCHVAVSTLLLANDEFWCRLDLGSYLFNCLLNSLLKISNPLPLKPTVTLKPAT